LSGFQTLTGDRSRLDATQKAPSLDGAVVGGIGRAGAMDRALRFWIDPAAQAHEGSAVNAGQRGSILNWRVDDLVRVTSARWAGRPEKTSIDRAVGDAEAPLRLPGLWATARLPLHKRFNGFGYALGIGGQEASESGWGWLLLNSAPRPSPLGGRLFGGLFGRCFSFRLAAALGLGLAFLAGAFLAAGLFSCGARLALAAGLRAGARLLGHGRGPQPEPGASANGRGAAAANRPQLL